MESTLKNLLHKAMQVLQKTKCFSYPLDFDVKIVRSRDPKHGDFVTHIAHPLSIFNAMSAGDAAHFLVDALDEHRDVDKIKILSSGVICFFMSPYARTRVVCNILKQKKILSSPDDPGLQYAYARTYGILQQFEAEGMLDDEGFGLEHVMLLTDSSEQAMLVSMECVMASVSDDLRVMCRKRLAHELQHYYNTVVLCCESRELRAARVCLLKAVCQVLSGDDGKKLHEKTSC